MMLLFDRCNPCVALSLLVIAAAVLVGCAGTPAPVEEPNFAEVIATFPQPYAGLESRPPSRPLNRIAWKTFLPDAAPVTH